MAYPLLASDKKEPHPMRRIAVSYFPSHRDGILFHLRFAIQRFIFQRRNPETLSL